MPNATEQARMVQPPTAPIEGAEITRIGQLSTAAAARLVKNLYGGVAGVWSGLTASATGASRVITVATGEGFDATGAAVVVPSAVPSGGNSPTVTLAVGDATNPRIDAIYLQALELDGDSVSTPTKATRTAAVTNQTLAHSKLQHFTIGAVAGTPAGSPVAPAIPAGAVYVADVAVAANATTISNGNITDRRYLFPTVPSVASPGLVLTFPAANALRAALPVAINDQAAAVYGGNTYMCGGMPSGGTSVTDHRMFDPVANTWTSKAALPTRRNRHRYETVGTKIYALSGVVGASTPDVQTEEYDPVANTWASKTVMPATGRYYFASGAVGTKIWVSGGHDGSAVIGSTYYYDTVANTWTSQAAMVASNRMRLAACVIGTKLYFFGGYTTVGQANNEIYDTVANSWSNGTAMVDTAYFIAAAAGAALGYAVGGITGASSNPFRSYNPTPNTWTTLTNMPHNSNRGACVMNGTTLFYMGGADIAATDYNTYHDSYSTAPTTQAVTRNGVLNSYLGVVTITNQTSGAPSALTVGVKTGDVVAMGTGIGWTVATANEAILG